MRLNLQILKDELTPLRFSEAFSAEPTVLSLDYALPYTKDRSLVSEVVFVAKGEDLPANPPIKGHPSLICIGKPPGAYLQEPFNTLWTAQGVSTVDVLGAVLEIFERYRKWGASMHQAISENRPLKELAMISLPFIDNPISVVRPNFKILFHVTGSRDRLTSEQYRDYCASYGADEVPVADGTVLMPDSVQEMISDPRYVAITEATEPVVSALGNNTYRTYCKNLRTFDGTCFARILIDEVYHDFTDRDRALFEILDNYFVERIQIHDPDDLERPVGLDTFMESLLAGQSVDERTLKGILDFYQWDEGDTFLAVVLKSKSFEQDAHQLGSFAARILAELPSNFFALLEESLLLVFNLTKTHVSKGAVLQQALPLLRDELFIIGVGTPFTGFSNARDYYLQATDAIERGTRIDPYNWVFHYEEYQLDSMLLRCLDGRRPESLFPEGLSTLIEYDEERGSDYVPFLRYYLEHEMSIAQVSAAFYLHRNTSVHRLKRIKEITGLDLDNPTTRFMLEFSFRIVDAQEGAHSKASSEP